MTTTPLTAQSSWDVYIDKDSCCYRVGLTDGVFCDHEDNSTLGGSEVGPCCKDNCPRIVLDEWKPAPAPLSPDVEAEEAWRAFWEKRMLPDEAFIAPGYEGADDIAAFAEEYSHAVRAPRLTVEQREAVKWAYKRLMFHACPNDEDAGEALLAAFAGELGEVAHVDMVLARRDALEHLSNRIDKIMHTLATAKEADALRAENARLVEAQARIEALEEEVADERGRRGELRDAWTMQKIQIEALNWLVEVQSFHATGLSFLKDIGAAKSVWDILCAARAAISEE